MNGCDIVGGGRRREVMEYKHSLGMQLASRNKRFRAVLNGTKKINVTF